MIIKGAAERHLVPAPFLFDKTAHSSHEQLEAVRLFQGHAEELLEVLFLHLRAVRRPEQIVNHALPFGKTNGERGGQLLRLDALDIFLHREGVDFELILQKGGRRTAEP